MVIYSMSTLQTQKGMMGKNFGDQLTPLEEKEGFNKTKK